MIASQEVTAAILLPFAILAVAITGALFGRQIRWRHRTSSTNEAVAWSGVAFLLNLAGTYILLLIATGRL